MDTTITATTNQDTELAKRSQEAAAKYLEYRGYLVVERDWTGQAGHIDIVAWDEDDTLCFVEVVGARSEDGMPVDDASPEKRRRMELIAMDYLKQADMRSNTSIRFDNITVCAFNEDHALLRHHISCLS